MISSSTFENITSERGGAIYLEQMGGMSFIYDSLFLGNTAQSAGAMSLIDPGEILIRNVTFQGNMAVGTDRNGEGGAIFYQCTPDTDFNFNCDVKLDSNHFLGNIATRKGGSLRYTNKNFTTVARNQTSGRLLQDGGLVDTNVYAGNVAPYGANIASYPSSVDYIITDDDSGQRIDSLQRKLMIASG